MGRQDRSRLLRLARQKAILTSKEIARSGVHSQVVSRLVEEGRLERLARGQVRLAGRPLGEDHALVAAARTAPRGVVCLQTALLFHGVGPPSPDEVQMALARGARTPAARPVPLRFVHFGGAAFTHGIEVHWLDGVEVRIYSVAKTVADLFRFRNRWGLDVARVALRDAWQDERVTLEDLESAARACRVQKVMQPYLLATTGPRAPSPRTGDGP